MPDPVLDDTGAVAARERFCTAALTDRRYVAKRTALGVRDDAVVGIAMAGPPLDDDATWALQLYVLYLLASDHGSGAGMALLNAVVPADARVSLWVADPNPRAQAFYRKHRFVPDGSRRVDDGIRKSACAASAALYARPPAPDRRGILVERRSSRDEIRLMTFCP